MTDTTLIFANYITVPFTPKDVRCYAMSSTEIEVSWQKGEYKTGPTNYSVSAIDDKKKATKFSCSTKGMPVYPRFLVGFVLFNLQFSVKCFIDYCLSFCPLFWALYCLSFFELWRLISLLAYLSFFLNKE